MIYDDLPKDEAHGWKFIGIGPDNKLYIPVGLPCNSCPAPDTHAQMRRINLDGSGAEVIARGMRNTVGFDWHPDIEAALLHRQWPRLGFGGLSRRRAQSHHQSRRALRQSRSAIRATSSIRSSDGARSCDEFVKPIAEDGAAYGFARHALLRRRDVPGEYENAIFFARRGSWNRTKKAGGDIVAVNLNKNGTVNDHAVHDRLPAGQQLRRRVRSTCWSCRTARCWSPTITTARCGASLTATRKAPRRSSNEAECRGRRAAASGLCPPALDRPELSHARAMARWR